MKKAMAAVVLVLFIIWGIYELAESDAGTGKASSSAVPSSTDANIDLEDVDAADEIGNVIGLEKGNTAPDFVLPTFDGEEHKLSDYRGKIVILNMWASWCPPCVVEMPHMQAYYLDHHDEVEVLAVNMTESERSLQDVSDFITEFELTFPIVLDEESQVADRYRITTLPTTFILNGDGRIEQKIVGPMTYETMDELVQQVED